MNNIKAACENLDDKFIAMDNILQNNTSRQERLTDSMLKSVESRLTVVSG